MPKTDLTNSRKKMEHHFSQNPKVTTKPNNKKKLTKDQVRLLERSFSANKKLEPELKLHLANQLGVPPRQVAIWYQNKRARWKTQSLELDYNTLQVKLENALADKRRLEREVGQLQEELLKARDMLFALNNNQSASCPLNYFPPPVSCNSTSCSERGGGSSLHDDVNNVEVLQLEELYACLIGVDGSTWG